MKLNFDSPYQQNITPRQIEYIEILANDLQLDRHRRNRHISVALGREIQSLDELGKRDASVIIEYFKSMKEGKTS